MPDGSFRAVFQGAERPAFSLINGTAVSAATWHMSLDHATVRRIARLARIEVADDEVETYVGELNNILNWIDQLGEVDTQNVPPMTRVVDMRLPMREDNVTDGNLRNDVLANAPATEDGCFVVPKVIE